MNHYLSYSLRWISNRFAITQNGQLQLQSLTFVTGLLLVIAGYMIWILAGR